MADLTITIDAQTLAGVRQAFSDVQRAFAQLENATRQAGTRGAVNLARIETKLGDISRQVRNWGLAMTGAMGGMVAMLARAGNEAIATEERLKAITRSASETQQVLQSIKGTDAFKLFGQEALEAAARLRSVGISAKALPAVVEAIADASASAGSRMGEAFGRITEAFAQVATKGKATAEEIVQQLSEFIPAQQLIAQSLGVTTAQLQEMMAKGLPAGKALKALVEGIADRFGEMSEAIKNTPMGQLMILRSTLKEVLTTAGTPLSRALTGVLKEINAELAKLAQSGELEPLARALAEGIKALLQAGKNLIPVLTSILNAFNSLPAPVRNTVATLALLSGPLALATAGMLKLGQGVIVVVNAIRAIPGAVRTAIAWLARLAGLGGAGAGGAGAGAAGAAASGAAAARMGLMRLGAVGAAFALTTASAGGQDVLYTEIASRMPAIQNRDEAIRTAYFYARNALEAAGQDFGSLVNTPSGQARLRQIYADAIAVATGKTPSFAPSDTARPLTTSDFGPDTGVSARGDSGRTGRTRTTDTLARQRAALDLARQAAELRIPPIAQLVAQGNLDDAARALAQTRSQLEQLVPLYIRLNEAEARAAVGRTLSPRERQTIAEQTRRDLLSNILNLEQQIQQARERQREQTEQQLQLERERLSQLQRELHALRARMLEERINALPPEEALKQLPTLQAMQSAPYAAELALAMIGGDQTRAQISATQLQIIQEQIARRRQQLEQQIADEQRRKAEERYQLALQTAQTEREINRLRAESAVALAESELQNARDTLQLLQQQGASREILKAQEEAVLQSLRKSLEARQAALQVEREQLQLEIQRLQVVQTIAALTGQTAQRNQAALQTAQAQLELARTEAALAGIERQIRNIGIVADEHNPFELWRRTVYDLTLQLTDGLADALLGLRKASNALKDFFRDLARSLVRIVLRELLNPLLDVVRSWAAQLGRAIFGNLVGNQLAGAAAGAAGGGGAMTGLASFFKTPFGQALGAAGIGYVAGEMLGLNPTGSAIGAGIGMAIGGPIGAVVGGLLGGLFGRRRRESPQPIITPLASGTISTPPLQITNTIRLYLDNREIARAIAVNAL